MAVQVNGNKRRRVFTSGEDLPLPKRTIAITKEDGNIAIITRGRVPWPHQRKIIVAIAVEIPRREIDAVLSDSDILC
jgi:hypothetical protein